MNIRFQTPLSSVPLEKSLRDALSSLWITSVEELVAMVSAIERQPQLQEGPVFGQGRLSSAINEVKAVLPSERLSVLSGARVGGSLGCLLDPQVLEDFRKHGRVRGVSARPKGAFEAKLPASVRLIDKMPAVRNQGQRSTCVAFGTLALREFLIGSGIDLSEQFLYWACKELDRYSGPGTYVHTAMTALAEYGVCEESDWPYNLNQLEDESQGPPPESSTKRAKNYVLPSTRTVEPNLVIHYKNVLAGDTGKGGMPITFATLVFNSWYMSAETHRTGKITMPLPGEQPVGGHAWCVVGYVDDEEAPGGGYFIVHNSWGTQWAPDSPEAPGHAVMPYEYVGRFAVEAFTGPTSDSEVTKYLADDDELRPYLIVLKSPQRDFEKKLLPAGKKVLVDRFDENAIMEDTRSNRVLFKNRYCTWKDESRVRVWFPDVDAVSPDLKAAVAAAQACKQQFAANIEENIKTSVHQLFPEVHQTLLHSLLPFEPRIRRVHQIIDLNESLVNLLQSESGVPQELDWPEYWHEVLSSTNHLVIYSVEALATKVHVVAAFVSLLQFKPQQSPSLIAPDATVIEAVRSIYEQWVASRKSDNLIFTFFTLGSSLPWSAEVQGVASGTHWIICSAPAKDGRWQYIQPPRPADRISLADFKDRLIPETRQQRISRIRTFIDQYLDLHFDDSNLDIERIKRGLKELDYDYRRSAILDAIMAIQGRASYRIYKTGDGHIAIDRNTMKKGIKIKPHSDPGNRIRRLMYVGAKGFGVGLITQSVNWTFYGTLFNWSSLGVAIVCSYLFTLYDKAVERLKEDKE